MKKIMFVGNIGCGKTSLSQSLTNQAIEYHKTQAVDVVGSSILDTPGEYHELGNYKGALMITSAEAEVIAFVQSATDERKMFSPFYAGCFAKPVIGIVTKIDDATEKEILESESHLHMAGADKIFRVSNYTKEGLDELKKYLEAK
ncbi:EutP/PduV family microcompartment system protein [Eubacteriales bacterium KG127]